MFWAVGRGSGVDEESRQSKVTVGLMVLSKIGEASPLFGLLGTVIGLWRLFRKLGTAGSLETQQILSAGLGEAMSTTVAGLSLGLFCLVLHLLLRAAVSRGGSQAPRTLEDTQ